MKNIVLISDDQLARRVFPKLLAKAGFEMSCISPAQSNSGSSSDSLAGKHGVVVDLRIEPELVVLRLLEFCGWSPPTCPVIVLHHRNEAAMKIIGPRLPVHVLIDAGNEALGSIICQISEILGATPEAETEAAKRVPKAPQDRAKRAPNIMKTKRNIQQPMRHTKRAGKQTTALSAKKTTQAPICRQSGTETDLQPRTFKFHSLYKDAGLLAEETGAASGEASGEHMIPDLFERKKRTRFQRRQTRDETISKLAEFAEAIPLKSSVQMALKIARDSTSSVDDLARVVKQDQALAARVLQLSNSSAHRRGSAVRTVEQAIVRLGVSALREIISSTAILDQFGSRSDVFNVPLLWEHGYAVGMLAADIARKGSDTSPDEAFIIGLMHDMGRAVMSHQFGQDYIDALLEARRHDVSPDKVEKQFFELNHSDVADTVFKTWDFDNAVISPIANHHLSNDNLKHLDPVHYRQTKVLQLADKIAHAALLGDSGSDWIDSSELKLEGVVLEPGFVRTSVQRASNTLDELRLAANSMDRDQSLGSCADNLRQQLPATATIASIGNEEVLDPMDLLAWRLGGAQWSDSMVAFGDPVGPSDRPDVLLGSVGRRVHISNLVASAEAHDVADRRIPLVLSVATKALAAEVKNQLSGRQIYIVPGAFRIAWVLRGINQTLAGEQHAVPEAA